MRAEGAWLEAERRRLVRLCASITGDAAAAEDLAQEALLEAWRSRHKLHDAAGRRAWLNAVARNVCLRFARRRGRDAAVVVDADAADAAAAEELDAELPRDELEGALERALGQLPPATRDVLVRHFVDGTPHAEIAARLGISEDAVSMRISRGRAALRRLLAEDAGEPDAGWRPTRVWCPTCGRDRLRMLRDTTVAFRCDACGPGPSAAYDLGNPSFAEVVGDLVRPSAILRRTGAWSSRYFHRGAGAAACTRCAHAIRLEVHADTSRCGLRGRCRACGEEVWSSAQGLVHGLPEARAFRHDHGRVRTLPARGLGYHGADALLVRLESLRGSASLDVVLRRDTLRVLAAH